ncbi:proton pump-interactor 1-like isoform X1 [Cornus florida]|uniref:proton pump-interactor 1-like isoform X1 n=1 Tax=Cornus florida TaxID=4283 RepID=UPI00289C6088|nr:proton pump-interactor 1-like isoform X1 [Cornus florida]XP_059661505.1 proton pump-interactor 1-like isoform X1 [Cornus florida]XP_059661506.1 proton pump-interactor 1-like isoform X1 [Cornus florida]
MGVEAVESELAQVSVETGSEENSSLLHEKENVKMNEGQGLSEPIKFGSHGLDELAKVETNNVLEANFPKGAVDEWPMPPQIHSFYFIKYRSYEDPKLKAKLDQADKDLQKKIQTRSQLVDKLREKRSDRAQVIGQMRSLGVENRQFRSIMDEKKKEMEPLHQALGKLRTTNSTGRDRGVSLCSSEEELNDIIKSLQYRIQHESIPLTEEKQILREIKQLEGTREKVTANAAMRAKIQESLGQKEVIQDQVKLMGADFDGVKKERMVVRAKMNQLEEERNAIDKEINSLETELTVMTQKRDEARQYLQNLKKQREEGNSCYFQNRTLLNKAKDFAAKKDIESLQKICDTEVENFMSLWSSNKALRDDYERRILPSLDFRQLSKDGRIRNPDEKSFVLRDAALPSETEAAAKTKVKQVKEDTISPPQHDSGHIQKVPKEAKGKQTGSGSTLEPLDIEKEISGLEKQQKDPPSKENELDAAKLKEMKREEEMAKSKQALERKKKLAEKAAAKAAMKAQKEAEKKLKEIID